VAKSATTYTVTGYNFSGSSSTTIVISTATLGSNDLSKNTIKLFPNPTYSILNLYINDLVLLNKVTITDVIVKIVLEQRENLSTINVEKLTKRVYIINACD